MDRSDAADITSDPHAVADVDRRQRTSDTASRGSGETRAQEHRGGRSSTRNRLVSPALARAGYAVLLVVAVPASLALWAALLDEFVALPAYGTPLRGGILIAAGLLLGAASALAPRASRRDLRHGPAELTRRRGPFRLVRHPLPVAAVAVSLGLAFATRSPAGLWITTPLLALGSAAAVVGLSPLRRIRHGVHSHRPRPLLHLTPDGPERPDAWDRVSPYALLFIPWLALYMSVEFLGTPDDAIMGWMAWDAALPVVPWAEFFYLLTYPFVLAVPIITRRRFCLRRFMIRGWTAMLLILPFYLLVPIIAPHKPVPGDGFFQTLMHADRTYNQGVTAFPAYHVVWPWLAALVYRVRWPRLEPLWWSIVALIAASCVLTGMHAAIDIPGAVAFVVVIVNAGRIATAARAATERLANARFRFDLGHVRLTGPGIYTGASAWLGGMVALTLIGPEWLWAIALVIAAAATGQLLWERRFAATSRLFLHVPHAGAVAGTVAGIGAVVLFGAPFWLLVAASAIGGAVAQAVGQLRCLARGCCVGAPTTHRKGIRYGRAVGEPMAVAAAQGESRHPVPLYSMVWMMVLAAALARLWLVGTGLEFIVGMYLILSALARFATESYRSTSRLGSRPPLRPRQWLVFPSILAGIVITTLGSTAPPPLTLPPLPALAVLAAVAAVVAVASSAEARTAPVGIER